MAGIPPQLLFLHAGQEDVKEVRFHRQLPGVVFSTAADGFNIFKVRLPLCTAVPCNSVTLCPASLCLCVQPDLQLCT